MPPTSPLRLPPTGLADGTIALRPWRDADVPAMTAACRDPEIQRWTMVPDDYDEADARAYVAAAAGRRAAGASLELAVVDAADCGAVLGSVALMRVDRGREQAPPEIGYWTAPAARGGGVAVRAVRLLSDWGLRELGLERIELQPFAGNVASQRVAERAGYVRERVVPGGYASKRGPVDVVLFALVRP